MSWNVKCHKISNIMTCWCWIYYPKQKHSEFHTSERTIVPQTAIFRLGTLVLNYICPKLLFKLCHYLLVREGFKKKSAKPPSDPRPQFGIFPEQKIYPHLFVKSFHKIQVFLAVTWQLNRWPCHSLSDWVTHFLFLTLKIDPRDQWPLRHLITVMRKHDLTNILTNLNFFEIFENFWQYWQFFDHLW